MQLQLRSPLTGRLPLAHLSLPASRWRGFRGLGDDTCQVPQPGVPMVYPPCPSAQPLYGTSAPPTYVPPVQVAVPACIQDTRPGGAAFTQECQQQLMAAQQQNMAAGSAANYDVDRANCETAWAANDARYAALGLPRPPNDCALRTFGLTLPGSSGGTNILIPSAQSIFDPNYAGPVGTPATGGGGGGTGSGNPTFAFTNLTSGDNTNFKVGDRWQLQITGGPPNTPVTVIGGMSGSNATNQMGTTDSAGRFSLNGQMDQSQIGNWSEQWKVGTATVAVFGFNVKPAGTVVTGGTGTGTGTKTPATGGGSFVGSSITIGGTDIPVWALGLAAVAVFFMFKGGK